MARIWTEPFDSFKHRSCIDSWGGDSWGEPEISRRAPTLKPHPVLLVHVCAFTFQFHAIVQLKKCLSFYEQKIPRGLRLRMPKNADKFDHWHGQAWFQRLPKYLREESKRRRVVKALQNALAVAQRKKIWL